MTDRPSWSAYFLDLARTVSTRATCPRRQVGCVLVRDRVVVSSGYNGAIRDAEHCPPLQVKTRMVDESEGLLWVEDPCTEGKGHCQRSIHAELNSLLSAAKHGAATDGCTAYVTLRPCLNCYRALVNAGVVEVVYAEEYGASYETSVLTRMCMYIGREATNGG